MARIRSIKPEMWKHEQLGRCSALARLTFIGLINFADDEGRGKADPESLWGEMHAFQGSGPKAQWKRTLSELKAVRDHDGPLVVFYKVAGASFYWLPGFCRQQYIEKPYPSKLPPPPNSGNDPLPIPNHSALERKGRERKGEDQGSRRGEEETPPLPSASPLPPEGQIEPLAETGPDQAEEAEIAETVARYAAWGHPPAPKKSEGVRELRALGLSHEYIRNGSQVNKPADVGFWDVVKALKAAGGKRSNGKARVPDSQVRENVEAYATPPRPTHEQREAERQMLSQEAMRCDGLLNAMDEKVLLTWQQEAEADAEAAKIPKGSMRETFIRAKLRLRVSKKSGGQT